MLQIEGYIKLIEEALKVESNHFRHSVLSRSCSSYEVSVQLLVVILYVCRILYKVSILFAESECLKKTTCQLSLFHKHFTIYNKRMEIYSFSAGANYIRISSIIDDHHILMKKLGYCHRSPKEGFGARMCYLI